MLYTHEALRSAARRPGFPAPAGRRGRTNVWRPGELEAWAAGREPGVAPPAVAEDPLVRFVRHVVRGEGEACDDWTGPTDRDGYASFRVLGADGVWRTVRAVRWLQERLHGPLAAGEEMEHECHTRDLSCPPGPCPHRRCTKLGPGHAIPLDGQENRRRARERPAAQGGRP